MNHRRYLPLSMMLAMVVSGVTNGSELSEILQTELPDLGHRNWIAIVDWAYPAQVATGIRMVRVEEKHIVTVEKVLDAIAKAPHVRPVIFVDAELNHVPESHAVGIEKFREELGQAVKNLTVKRLPHARIIELLDRAGEKFQVLMLKTDLTLPYTSVFIQLEAGYWSSDAEAALRAAIGEANEE